MALTADELMTLDKHDILGPRPDLDNLPAVQELEKMEGLKEARAPAITAGSGAPSIGLNC